MRAIDDILQRDSERAARCDIRLLVPSVPGRWSDWTPLRRIEVRRVGRLRGHLWEQLELPRYARGGLLLSLAQTGPVLMRHQVVTIHDAAVFAAPEGFSLPFRTWHRLLGIALGRMAARVVTVSSFSARELRRYCRIAESKITVVPPGVDHLTRLQPDYGVLDRHGLGDRPFVLSIGSLNPNKNLHGLSAAVCLLGRRDYEFVVAGADNRRVFRRSEAGVPNGLRWLGYVTDQELRALYERATCFVHASLYEGFGLPPLEAMACGCPVVASNRAALPETCGRAALYCDPTSPEDIARKIQMVMGDPGLRADLRCRGLERIREFAWERSARVMLAVADEVAMKREADP
ncbi:MAG TPA: glycosyltransferase family 1 protein [Dehalococcoidia bacterium]|nr:glycosyltransferase family 1 protein [Dehalococcoidia bacterium]